MQLQPLLSEYLLETGTLPLAVSRQLCIVQKPAVLQEDGSMVSPPGSSIVFSEIDATDQARKNLITFISSRLSISAEQATEILDKEGNLEKAFIESELVDWPAIGQFQKQADGTISFLHPPAFNNYWPGIVLKQTKQQAEVKSATDVAEPEVLNEAIYDLEEPVQKDNWWVWAIVILVVSVALILFRLL